MLHDITLGQYYPVQSIIHKLDPRVKLSGTVLFLISLFINNNFMGLGVAVVALALTIGASKVPFKFFMRGMKAIVFLLLISVIFNLLFTAGTPVFEWGRITITEEGIYNAVFLFFRLSLLVVGSSLMTYTTTPSQLTDGMERGMRFLKVVKVPVHEIAMMMSIALRFIPILVDETDKIMKAQTARGADFENGNLIKRIKSLVPLLVPLFVSAFRRANDLAMAMEARCYRGGDHRTKMKPLKYKRADAVAYICILAYLSIICAIRINL